VCKWASIRSVLYSVVLILALLIAAFVQGCNGALQVCKVVDRSSVGTRLNVVMQVDQINDLFQKIGFATILVIADCAIAPELALQPSHDFRRRSLVWSDHRSIYDHWFREHLSLRRKDIAGRCGCAKQKVYRSHFILAFRHEDPLFIGATCPATRHPDSKTNSDLLGHGCAYCLMHRPRSFRLRRSKY
jgi:hypothetical protein